MSGTEEQLKQRYRGKEVWSNLGKGKAEFGQKVLRLSKLLPNPNIPSAENKTLFKAKTKQERAAKAD
jgi:hypothetical protein